MSGYQILLLAWFGFTAIAIVILMILSYFNDRRVEREWSDEAEGLGTLQAASAETWYDPDEMSFDSAWIEEEE